MALSKSFPTPSTHELFAVVTSEAVGAALAALLLAVAPIPPDPFAPEELTPAKLITVREEITLCDKFAVTVAPLTGEDAKARHISEEPLCPLVLTTRVHVRPPPEILSTLVLAPLR